MVLSEKLAALRKEHGYSQLYVAERLNVSRQAISRWEVGSSVPSTENLMELSRLYGVSLDELVGHGAESPTQATPEREAVHEEPVPPSTENRHGSYSQGKIFSRLRRGVSGFLVPACRQPMERQ